MALIAPPLALYLHFPWCVRKCPYCDFNSHALKAELPQESYLEALLADLDAQPALIGDRPIVSLFLGGGTPSLFSPDAIGRLLEAIGKRLRIAGDAEITLEANPGTIERGRFGEYRAAGINRVSLGAQSFDPAMLERLGRIHSAAETRTAVAELRAAGLANFNIDLMYALPGQDLAGALADVRAAIELEPAHLSHYQLTMEPGTVFGGRPPPGLPDEDLSYEMQLSCQAELAAGGYAQYEISAYAREGAQCAHNLNYWNFGDYLGVGAGAHGKLSEGASGEIVRTVREREPRRYLARAHAVALQVTQVPKSDLPYEFMMNALRLRSGFERSQYEARTGLGFETISAAIRRLEGRGLLLAAGPEGKGWSPTEFGRRFLNDLIGEFLPVRPGA
jgi:oxygen-independent coproporphyrinogen-3 oxidase